MAASTTFKLRAECQSDIMKFLAKSKEKIEKPIVLKTIEKGLPDMTLTFKSKHTVEELLTVLRKQTDSHVMVQTLQPIKLYTGVRNYER